VEDGENIYKTIEDIKNGELEIETREKVLQYSWDNIAKKLVDVYRELISEEL